MFIFLVPAYPGGAGKEGACMYLVFGGADRINTESSFINGLCV